MQFLMTEPELAHVKRLKGSFLPPSSATHIDQS